MRLSYINFILCIFFLFPVVSNAQVDGNDKITIKLKAIGQTQNTNPSKNSFLLGFDILSGNKTASPRWKISYRRHFTSTLSGGIGTGFTYYNDPLSLLPVYATIKYRLLKTLVFPFIAIKAGYNFSILTHTNTLVDDHNGGLLLNPVVGIQIPLKTGNAFYISAGYNVDKASFSYKLS